MRALVWGHMDRDRRGWTCDQCHRDPRTLASRGRCGGPLTGRAGGMDDDADGSYVRADDAFASDIPMPFAGHRFRVCPVYLGHPEAHPWLATLLRHWQRWRRFGWPGLGDAPTDALVDAVDALEAEALVLRGVEQARAAALRAAARKARESTR